MGKRVELLVLLLVSLSVVFVFVYWLHDDGFPASNEIFCEYRLQSSSCVMACKRTHDQLEYCRYWLEDSKEKIQPDEARIDTCNNMCGQGTICDKGTCVLDELVR